MKNSAYEIKALGARTAWLRPAFQWSVRFALQGPWWLPGCVRRVPLGVVVWLQRRELRGLRDGL